MVTEKDVLELYNVLNENMINIEGFDSKAWLCEWIDSYVPALGTTPAEMLDREDGMVVVKRVLGAHFSGAFQ